MQTPFEKLGCPEFLAQTCKQVGLTEPTGVQKACIKQIITGHNVIALSQTGTGKTAAFALPIISTLSEDPYGIYALVISPTRELAQQIAQQFRIFGKGVNADVVTILGGMAINDQAHALERNPHIVVATPGRILQHLRGTTRVSFENIRYLVLDEVDRLFNDGFWDDVLALIEYLPKERQTLLFSATFSDAIDLHTILTKPPCVQNCPLPVGVGEPKMSDDKQTFYWKPSADMKPKIEHLKIIVQDESREVYLVILMQKIMETDSYKQALVFTNTCEEAETICLILRQLQFKTAVMHSKMEECDRLQELERFRAGQQRILVATDVAARGLDIPFVDTVVHYGAPSSSTTYVHRAGRTGRAGREGRSILLVSGREKRAEEKIEAEIGQPLGVLEIDPEEFAEKSKVFWARRDAKVTMRKNDFGQRDEYLKALDKIHEEAEQK